MSSSCVWNSFQWVQSPLHTCLSPSCQSSAGSCKSQLAQGNPTNRREAAPCPHLKSTPQGNTKNTNSNTKKTHQKESSSFFSRCINPPPHLSPSCTHCTGSYQAMITTAGVSTFPDAHTHTSHLCNAAYTDTNTNRCKYRCKYRYKYRLAQA